VLRAANAGPRNGHADAARRRGAQGAGRPDHGRGSDSRHGGRRGLINSLSRTSSQTLSAPLSRNEALAGGSTKFATKMADNGQRRGGGERPTQRFTPSHKGAGRAIFFMLNSV